jgi:hypothetical protein
VHKPELRVATEFMIFEGRKGVAAAIITALIGFGFIWLIGILIALG